MIEEEDEMSRQRMWGRKKDEIRVQGKKKEREKKMGKLFLVKIINFQKK